jgi:hypothetical protein
MKRFIILAFLSLAMSICPFSMKAGDFGIVGGASFFELKNLSMKKTTGYHAGFTYKFNLPVGFSIQPSLVYHMKSAATEAGNMGVDFNVGYVEFPLSFQWGPDLLIFRPFLDVSPFIGYGLNFGYGGDLPEEAAITKDNWNDLNRFEYGLGLGGGLEIWKFQFTCRYHWNLGNLAGTEKVGSVTKTNFNGVTLSVALLF